MVFLFLAYGMGNTCKPMAVSFLCMTKSTTIKKKSKKKKKRSLSSTGLYNYHTLPNPSRKTPVLSSRSIKGQFSSVA